ncbi:MAG: TIGR00297 family protein [Acidobacteriota bacterium]
MPAQPRLTGGEVLRKLVHMGVGLIALVMPFLGAAWSALCALTAVLGNLFVLPHIGGRRLWREHESARGASQGIVLYPLAVLLLILAFWPRLEIAAGVWGILAFGDGMASLVGMGLGGPRLGWNPRKTWSGFAAYVLFGGLGCWGLVGWMRLHAGEGSEFGAIAWGFLAIASFATALLAGFVESLDLGLDDNIRVPLIAGLTLLGLLQSQAYWASVDLGPLLHAALIGGAVNLVLAGAGYAARSVNRSGFVAGWLIGTTIFTFLGWSGYLVLLAFFVGGTAATKLGYQRKAKAKLAQEGGGRRGAKHALANTLAPAIAAVFAATAASPLLDVGLLYRLGFVAAFATALGDTLGSEIGQLYGRRTFLITTLKPVPRGTEGAVSLEGTLAGLAGSLAVAALGAALGLYGAMGVAIVTVAAFLGTTLESLIGATLEARGWLDNEAVNFLNTLTGALLAAGLGALLLPGG